MINFLHTLCRSFLIQVLFHRDRIIHILALRPYKKPELLARLMKGKYFKILFDVDYSRCLQSAYVDKFKKTTNLVLQN